MKPEYILLISAGGVFLLLLFIYLLVAFERYKKNKAERQKLQESYSDENLSKMEYDVAYYDKKSFKLNYNTETERQVTIDDLIAEESSELDDSAEKAIFAQVEDEGVEEIKGTYKPSN